MRKSWIFKNPILVTQSITNIGFELLYQMQMHYSAKTEHMYEVNTQKSTQGALISNTLERELILQLCNVKQVIRKRLIIGILFPSKRILQHKAAVLLVSSLSYYLL